MEPEPEQLTNPPSRRVAAHTRRLNRATRRVDLIRDLAAGMMQVDAAERYGVTQQAISAFAQRHAAEILQARRTIEDEMAGVWIAAKRNRLLAYQADVEDIEEMPAVQRMARLGDKHRALRNAAEELGALKQVIQADVVVRHELVGVNPEDLR